MRRLPYTFRAAVVIGAIFVVGFVATVVPLFVSGGEVRAEIAGSLPGSIAAGQPTSLVVAVDNTSGSIITPICVAVRFRPAVGGAVVVRFQGLDTVPVTGGRACGGSLSGQETINAQVRFTAPAAPGTLHVSLVAGQGGRDIGPALSGDIAVTR